MTDKVIDSETGALMISPEFVVSKQTKLLAILAFFGEDNMKIWDVKNGYMHYSIIDVPLNDSLFWFNFTFHFDQLSGFYFAFDYSPDESWDNWSEEKELKRAEKYNQWLTMQVGEQRHFPWGTLWAGYDAKGGFSCVSLNYSL